jgi:hypothetical protein
LIGIVRDAETGQPLAGAAVMIVETDRSVTSSADGRYVLVGVPAGPHHISISALGYETRTLHALVPASATLEVDVSLRARPIPMAAVSVELRVRFRGLEATNGGGFPDRSLSREAVRSHPGLSEPDALRALAGGDAVVEPEAGTGLHVRGGTPDQLAYLLDGSFPAGRARRNGVGHGALARGALFRRERPQHHAWEPYSARPLGQVGRLRRIPALGLSGPAGSERRVILPQG